MDASHSSSLDSLNLNVQFTEAEFLCQVHVYQFVGLFFFEAI